MKISTLIITFFLVFQFGKPTLAIDPECIVTQFDQVPTAVESCDDLILGNFTVPGGETLRLPLRDGATLTFQGNITFEYKEHVGYLVIINGTNVVIRGEPNSLLYGQGELYWDGTGQSRQNKPKFFALTLHNSVMYDINILNAPMHCVQLFDSTNVQFFNWLIDNSAGDGDDPLGHSLGVETDGFDVRNSTNIVIKNNEVHNQDDCVALNSGANILVEDMKCYGGHGLSLSVGFSDDEFILNSLQNITIRNSYLVKGWNGIHIKTHPDSGEGIIRNVTYSNIQFVGTTKTGIWIQENYGGDTDAPSVNNNIPIRDLTLENIVGAVQETAIPLYIVCAEEGCFDWKFNNVIVAGLKDNNCTAAPEGITC